MGMHLRHLRLVREVERAGTLTAAARALHLSQSALSHQLARLEDQVGGVVFERKGRRMVPTALGRRLIEGAGEVLGALGALELDLAELVQGRTGLLRVTSECYTCYHWLADVLPAFRARHPAVEVRIVPEAAGDALRALDDGQVDVVLSDSGRETAGVVSRPLFVDEQVLIVAPGHRLATRAHVVADDLVDEHLLVYRDDPSDSLFYAKVLVPAGVSPARVSEVRLTEGILALVAAGGGVAVLTRWTAAPEIAAGKVIALRIGPKGLMREWRALHAEANESGWLGDFLDLMAGGPLRLFDDRPEQLDAAGLGGAPRRASRSARGGARRRR